VRNALRKKDALGRVVIYTLGAVLFALPFFTARNHFFTHDRSKNYTCRDYAINMLIGLDRDAVLFTNGDNDTFPLWYIQEVENYRKDIRVVNLSLLNTPWYIRQLRDNEPKAPISWSDREIDNLGHFATKEGWILIRDQAVRHILRENKWKQPVYFAVTIPPETYSPYRDYLEMQGLAYLLVPRKGKNMINEEVMKENILNKFSYRSILTEDWKRDDSVYLPGHTRHLIQNYAGAFIQLAFYIRDKNPKEALRHLEIAQQISPGSEHVARLLGLFYFESGDTAKAIAHYENEIRKHPNMTELLWHLAGIYERTGDDVKTLDLLDELLRRNPNDRNTVLSALGLSLRANLYKRGRNYLAQWLSTHPNDEDIRRRLNWLDSLLEVTPAEE
jgi:hypothetical protein